LRHLQKGNAGVDIALVDVRAGGIRPYWLPHMRLVFILCHGSRRRDGRPHGLATRLSTLLICVIRQHGGHIVYDPARGTIADVLHEQDQKRTFDGQSPTLVDVSPEIDVSSTSLSSCLLGHVVFAP
jgi:hypothetical protein